MTATEQDLERNLRLYGVHEFLSQFFPWLPVFTLFTRGAFGLEGALVLAAIHYFVTVVAEVPSGWLSDRLGRVVTLRVTALLWMAAHALYWASDGRFWVVVIAHTLAATGFAALSGTNVSFLFDTLEGLGRGGEYEVRQARFTALAHLSLGLSALVGGAVGLIDVRVVFPLSMVAATAQLAVTWWLSEPPQKQAAADFFAQLVECARYVRRPQLAWVLGYWMAMIVLEHLAFEVAQPYLTEALGNAADDLGETPLVAGVQFAGFFVVGAVAARAAAGLRRRLGFFGVLLAGAALSGAVITAMAIWVSPWVIGVMLLRSVNGAVGIVVLTAHTAPQVERHHRATYLSMNSLAGRLLFGSILFLTARAIGDDLETTLTAFAIIAWSLVAVLTTWMALSPTVRRSVAMSG